MSLLLISLSCSKNDDPAKLSAYDLEVIAYFKTIALGFEFGTASAITRKWNSAKNVFIGGTPNSELLAEFDSIKDEINELSTDGFKISVVRDSLESNYYLLLGSGMQYGQIFPDESHLVNSNLGLFYLLWGSQNYFYSGHMYVDIERANLAIQKHLLREEFTQSLGLAMDSPLYPESIFQSLQSTTTEYADIDRDLIRLLYHPDLDAGLDVNQVDEVLTKILARE